MALAGEQQATYGVVVELVKQKKKGREERHGSRATSTIGRESKLQNGTSKQLEKLAPTLESYTPSTWWTSQQLWIPWT